MDPDLFLPCLPNVWQSVGVVGTWAEVGRRYTFDLLSIGSYEIVRVINKLMLSNLMAP